MSRPPRRQPFATPEEQAILDKINLAFKMYEIEGMSVVFESVAKGSERPFRLVRKGARGSYVPIVKSYFGNIHSLDEFCERKIIKQKQIAMGVFE